jgi:hypothetical protein
MFNINWNWHEWKWYKWAFIAIGIGIVIDSIGSIMIQGGQYHNIYFDGERYIRLVAGVVIIILGLYIP